MTRDDASSHKGDHNYSDHDSNHDGDRKDELTRAEVRRSVLYIAGYGRSGSTVLDVALGSHPEVIGTGELSELFGVVAGRRRAKDQSDQDQHDQDQPGMDEVGTDTFWTELAREAARAGDLDLAGADRLTTNLERLLPATGLLPGTRRRSRYLALHGHLLRSLFHRTGARSVVDSSKTSHLTTWRLALLAAVAEQEPGFDLYCVILVRRLPDVIASIRSGRGDSGRSRQRLPATRAIVGWSIANISATVLGLVCCGKDRTRLLRYDDFGRNPGPRLTAVHRFVGLEADSEAVRSGLADGFKPSHQVYGNRVREQRSIVIRATAPQSITGPVGLVAGAVERTVNRLALSRVLDVREDPNLHTSTVWADRLSTTGAERGGSAS
jgi:hypothetical protein